MLNGNRGSLVISVAATILVWSAAAQAQSTVRGATGAHPFEDGISFESEMSGARAGEVRGFVDADGSTAYVMLSNGSVTADKFADRVMSSSPIQKRKAKAQIKKGLLQMKGAADKIASLFARADRADINLKSAVKTIKSKGPLTSAQTKLVSAYRTIISRVKDSTARLDKEIKAAIASAQAAAKADSTLKTTAYATLKALKNARVAAGLQPGSTSSPTTGSTSGFKPTLSPSSSKALGTTGSPPSTGGLDVD